MTRTVISAALGCCIALLLLLSSCNGYEKVLKSNDVNYKLTKANEYYDKKQYTKANELYRTLLPVLKGTRNYEPLYYKFAYSFYYMKDWLDASYHFKNFTDFFPASKDAEECEYMHAVCLYKLSPKASLEQTNTEKATEAMQTYINNHPNSKRLAEANTYLDQSRRKLEDKEASAARLYYNLSQYKAAAIAYKSVLQDYPESLNSDYYQFMIVKSLYFYARASVVEKQEERYASAATAYEELREQFPKSTLLPEAARYQTLANANIAKSRQTHEHQ